jgi:hypothetical protein
MTNNAAAALVVRRLLLDDDDDDRVPLRLVAMKRYCRRDHAAIFDIDANRVMGELWRERTGFLTHERSSNREKLLNFFCLRRLGLQLTRDDNKRASLFLAFYAIHIARGGTTTTNAASVFNSSHKVKVGG